MQQHPAAQLQALMMQRHAQLREQAEEMGDAHRELRRWEEEMARRDEALRQRRREGLVRAQREQEEGPTVKVTATAEGLRAEGNEHYKRGAFEEAVGCYTQCLVIDSHSVLALSNRAMAHLKLRLFDLSFQDATAALALDPHHVKSLERRAAALVGLGRQEEARRDLEAAIRLHPGDGELLGKLQGLVEEETGGAAAAADEWNQKQKEKMRK